MASNEMMNNDEIQKLLEQMAGSKPKPQVPDEPKVAPLQGLGGSSFSQNDIEALINAKTEKSVIDVPAQTESAQAENETPSVVNSEPAVETFVENPADIALPESENLTEKINMTSVSGPAEEAAAVETSVMPANETAGNVSETENPINGVAMASPVINEEVPAELKSDKMPAPEPAPDEFAASAPPIVTDFTEPALNTADNEIADDSKQDSAAAPAADAVLVTPSDSLASPVSEADPNSKPEEILTSAGVDVLNADNEQVLIGKSVEMPAIEEISETGSSDLAKAKIYEEAAPEAEQVPESNVVLGDELTGGETDAIKNQEPFIPKSSAGASSFFDILSGTKSSNDPESKSGDSIFKIADEVIDLNQSNINSALAQAESNFNSQILQKDNEIRELQASIDSLIEENGDTVGRLSAAETELDAANVKIKQLECEILNLKNNGPADAVKTVSNLENNEITANIDEVKIVKADLEEIKALNKNLEKKLAELNDELSTKDALILRLEEQAASFTTAVVSNADDKDEISRLQKSLEMITAEKLQLNDELTEKNKKIAELAEAFESLTSQAESAKDGESSESNETEKLNSVDGIKEKFQKLMQERDQAIELLNKFEVEAKKAKIELEHLKENYKSAVEERDNSLNELKEKSLENDKVYATMAKYKEDSGFMSRELKTLKEEKEHLNDSLTQKIKEAEEKIQQLNDQLADKENAFNAREEEFRNELNQKENEFLFEKEAANAEIKELTRRLEVLNQQFNASFAESNNFSESLERIYSQLCDADPSFKEGADDTAETNIESKVIFLTEGGENDIALKSPDMIFECLTMLEIKHEVKTYDEYISSDINSAKSALCIFAALEDKKLISKVYESSFISKNVPYIVYGSGLSISDYDVSSMFVSGAVSDYIDFKMSREITEAVIKRNIEKRIARVGNFSMVKDQNELKLRESVALSIETRVKSNKIETLNNQMDYLRQVNKKMRSSINELEFAFGNILSIISSLSTQELPENITEKFNSITDILIKVSEKKI